MLLIIAVLQISTLSHFCGYLNLDDATQTQSDALQCVYKSADWQNRKEFFSGVCTSTKEEIGIPQLYGQIELRLLSQFQVAVVRYSVVLRSVHCVSAIYPTVSLTGVLPSVGINNHKPNQTHTVHTTFYANTIWKSLKLALTISQIRLSPESDTRFYFWPPTNNAGWCSVRDSIDHNGDFPQTVKPAGPR